MAQDGSIGPGAREPRPASPAGHRTGRFGLSGRLLVLTILFVMIAEVLIFLPSIAKYRIDWLSDRLRAAQLAALAAEAAPGGTVPGPLRNELLRNAQVRAIAVKRSDQRVLVLPADMPVPIHETYDLTEVQRATGVAVILARLALVRDALAVYVTDSGPYIRILGIPGQGSGDMIEIVLPVAPLKAAMITFALNILSLSIIISMITAGLIYLALNALLVRPITRISANMERFAESPHDASRIITPSRRRDEVGTAERELAHMQSELSQLLHQKSRLAALGLAVSKISHDLRNLLANAQLVSDRLATLPDPAVQRFAPKLIASLDRAIAFCNDSLKFGRAEEATPRRERIALRPLVEEVGEALALPREGITWNVDVPADLLVDADRDQLFRVLNNIARNSAEALKTHAGERGGTIRVAATRANGRVTLTTTDDGPGVPEKARLHLFQPFHGSARKGGTGLGLAIASELVAAHGGSIRLEDAPHGATFVIEIPDRAARS